jgi:hypothetical protein
MPEQEFQQHLSEIYVERTRSFVRALGQVMPKVHAASADAAARGSSPEQCKKIAEYTRETAMLAAAMELPGYCIELKEYEALPEWEVGDLPLPDGSWRLNFFGDTWILVCHQMYFWPVFEDPALLD